MSGSALIAAVCAGAVVAGGACAAPVQRVVDDGVVLDAAISDTVLTACLSAQPGIRLNGPYGVVVSAVSRSEIWDEPLPKTVATKKAYFALPLRVAVKRRPGAIRDGRLQFEVGACSSDGMCMPVTLTLQADHVAKGARAGRCRD